MMGHEPPAQGKLFYLGLNLERRVRANHPLRHIHDVVDFDFVYAKVRDLYGDNGNVSIAPPVILKLLLLLVIYNVRSERELMDTLPERLDWLWFCGYDLDSDIPNHSVLSKARARWGVAIFKEFFERIVHQCVEAGLVDPNKLFVDSSLVEANASMNSVVDTRSLAGQLSHGFKVLQARLDEEPRVRDGGPYTDTNARFVSATDPDSTLVRRDGTRLRYQVHRAVEGQSEIITATSVTPGDVNEGHLLLPLADAHEANTGTAASTLVADSKYGTKDNYLECYDRGIRAHIPSTKEATDKRLEKRGMFGEERFEYEETANVIRCPAGESLKPRTIHASRQAIEFKAQRRTCANCGLRDQCTRDKTGRSVTRHVRQADLDRMEAQAKTSSCRRDLHRRQHIAEGSFAQAKRYGYKRARWRRLWRVEIQNYLTCAVQNIAKLVQCGPRTFGAIAALRAAVSLKLILHFSKLGPAAD